MQENLIEINSESRRPLLYGLRHLNVLFIPGM